MGATGKFVLALAMLVLGCLSAGAHPHIWVDARTAVVFDDDGAIAAIRHQWTFDEAFSSWSIQGMDENGDGVTSSEELQSLAHENMVGLADYGFYTFGRDEYRELKFTAGPDPRLSYENGRSVLSFTLIPSQRIWPGRDFSLEVADPEYYVAMTFPDEHAVTLENAPASCSARTNPPREIPSEIEDRLYNLGPDVTELPPDLKAAAEDLANVLVIDCGGAARTAAQAVAQVARTKPAPFAAPPAEKGLPTVRTGVLGWIYAQQQAFYGVLTKALGDLRTDGNAFVVLGVLSFLYGVFHAAGPGHGKVVISSYVLATEAEVRRSIALSFAAAMLQSAVAVAFVLVAATLLNLTSLAMSEAAGFMALASYGLVVVLGLWLVVRKVFGLGHGHTHHHKHDHGDRGHVHAVTPEHLRHGWQEALGVVVAVGMRPCSGALVVLVFALSQGVLLAGIAATFLMGLGTALTVAALATMATAIKGVPRLIGGSRHAGVATRMVWWVELSGALLVVAFGLLLLLANL